MTIPIKICDKELFTGESFKTRKIILKHDGVIVRDLSVAVYIADDRTLRHGRGRDERQHHAQAQQHA